jgi:hypothetical protein
MGNIKRSKFDHYELANMILDSYPEKIFKSKTTTFIDPAMGGGQFCHAVENRLRDYGHSDENISQRVFGFESVIMDIRFAVNKYKLVGQYSCVKPTTYLETETLGMKFDAILGNPPYQGKAALHQQFFNKSVDLLKDGGHLSIIQPATPYFNKKEKKKKPEADMLENVLKYQSSVKIVRPDAFKNASIQNYLAVTTLVKTQGDETLSTVEYANGEVFHDVKLEDISMTQIDPKLYASIRNKYQKYIDQNGSLQDHISRDISKKKAALPKIRGTLPTDDDFYSFVPLAGSKELENWTTNRESDFGVGVSNNDQRSNVYDYLTSDVALFGLAILKFSQNTANKEYAFVPWVDMDNTYTNQELFKLLNLTKKEINAVDGILNNRYRRPE